MTKHRSGRINEEMRKELSNIIRTTIKDPRLSAMVSVTQVEATKDLRYAKVYVSIFGSEEEKNSTLAALKNSAVFMRKEIGHSMNLRYTPELIIEIDNSIEHGMHMEAIFKSIQAKKNDNE